MNDTRSGNDFPIRHTDQINTRSTVPFRIASISAASPGRRSGPRADVGRSVNIRYHGPSTFGCDRLETLDLIVGGKGAIRA